MSICNVLNILSVNSLSLEVISQTSSPSCESNSSFHFADHAAVGTSTSFSSCYFKIRLKAPTETCQRSFSAACRCSDHLLSGGNCRLPLACRTESFQAAGQTSPWSPTWWKAWGLEIEFMKHFSRAEEKKGGGEGGTGGEGPRTAAGSVSSSRRGWTCWSGRGRCRRRPSGCGCWSVVPGGGRGERREGGVWRLNSWWQRSDKICFASEFHFFIYEVETFNTPTLNM